MTKYGTLINGTLHPAPRQQWRGFIFQSQYIPQLAVVRLLFNLKNPQFPPCRNITDLIYYQRT